jgi:hypothetical protein
MRKRIGIGVVVAALLFGLVAPSVNRAAGSDQVVMAGVGAGFGEAIERSLQRGLQALARFLLRARLNPAEVEAAISRLEGLAPLVAHTPVGQEIKLGSRQRWQLIRIGCIAKDLYQFQREDEVYKQLGMLGEQLPDDIGLVVSVYNLANELAEAKDNGDRVQKAAVAGVCMRADRALK